VEAIKIHFERFEVSFISDWNKNVVVHKLLTPVQHLRDVLL